MKKIVFIFLFDLGLVGCVVAAICLLNVYASSRKNEMGVMYDADIVEEILPMRDSKNNFLGINCTITIPSDFQGDSIKITPDIFGGIREYKKLESADEIETIIEIKNKSKFNYIYKNASFKLGTESFADTKNYKDTLGVGFDKKKIYDIFAPYRVLNGALRELYNNVEVGNLDDKELDSLLIEKGYNGIGEIDKYYLDYYNKKYEQDAKTLEELPYSIIKEIFDGNVSEYRETNKRIDELAYYYFYNKVITVNFLGEMVNDSNSEYFSIGSYIKKNRDDKAFRESIDYYNSNLKIEGMIIRISKFYMTDSFKDYDYRGYMEFTLEKKE